jgi:TRAP-type C4-dicarboxylate transport system permease small subunit
MKMLRKLISKLSGYMAVVAGTTLVFVMLLTVVDVTMRYFGHPITGVYDFVALGGAIIIGFSIPYAADKRVHVFMEMLQQVHSRVTKKIIDVFTRSMAFGISLIIAWHLIKLGMAFRVTGEASLTVQVAYYPIAIGLALCFILQTLVFAAQIFEVFSGGSDE